MPRRSGASEQEDAGKALQLLEDLDEEATQDFQPILQKIERHLVRLAGKSFGSLAANQAVAHRIHELLNRYGLRVECPKCHQPAILRCTVAGNTRIGVFQFDHSLTGRRSTHLGSSVLPELRAVSAPVRRRSRRATKRLDR